MERDIILTSLAGSRISVNDSMIDKLLNYAEIIHLSNRQFNITGFKTRKEIVSDLILKSIIPLRDIIVPRGTRFIDLGSGAGIPGIVIGICFDGIAGTLVEANHKKAEFINSALRKLDLSGLEVVCGRAELIASDARYRDTFDFCFARAFAKYYAVIEIGAPFLRKGGLLFIYSNDSPESLHHRILEHSVNAGLHVLSRDECEEVNFSSTGLCFKKVSSTPVKYPRSFAVIKREAERADRLMND